MTRTRKSAQSDATQHDTSGKHLRSTPPVIQMHRGTAASTQDCTRKLTVSAKEAAVMLGISPRTLWGLTNASQVPHVKVGRRVLYPVEALEEWVRQRAERSVRRR